MNDLDIKRVSYPRVSDVIGKQNANEMRAIPIEHLVNASVRGTAIHNYCTLYVKNLWVNEVNPEYAPYFEAFKIWYTENVEKTLFSSTRLYDDEKCFTGEFDMIVKLNDGRVCLLDIKTSATKSKTWPIQLAAYKHLCNLNGFETDDVMNLHLKAKERAVFESNEQGEKVMISPPVVATSVIRYDNNNEYWEIFASALRCYDYFDRKEKK